MDSLGKNLCGDYKRRYMNMHFENVQNTNAVFTKTFMNH